MYQLFYLGMKLIVRDSWMKVVEQARTLYRLQRFIRRWNLLYLPQYRTSRFTLFNFQETVQNVFNFMCDCKVTIHFSADELGKSSCLAFR